MPIKSPPLKKIHFIVHSVCITLVVLVNESESPFSTPCRESVPWIFGNFFFLSSEKISRVAWNWHRNSSRNENVHALVPCYSRSNKNHGLPQRDQPVWSSIVAFSQLIGKCLRFPSRCFASVLCVCKQQLNLWPSSSVSKMVQLLQVHHRPAAHASCC